MGFLNIDGSFGEGGGQILRSSLTLSAITQKPICIKNIRIHRSRPGLQPQHLTACLTTNQLCQGEIQGTTLGSTFLTFQPREIQGGIYSFNIGTAGSLILLAQTLIPICLFAKKPTQLRLTGGTHVTRSPNYDYFEKVFLPAIKKLGAPVSTKLIKIGYYPKGGGLIELDITPEKLHGCCKWDQKKDIHAIIRLSKNLPLHIAERERDVLLQHKIKNINICIDESFSSGNTLTIWSGFKGACVLGKKGKPAEEVAEEAVQLFKQEQADIDHYLADQLLIYAALAEGKTYFSTSYISEHLRTQLFILPKFISKKFQVENNTISVQ